MIEFIFTQKSKQVFEGLPSNVRERISVKLSSLRNHSDIFAVIRGVSDLEPATHRLRVGDYRLLLALVDQKEGEYTFWILKVGHRRDIYRGVIG